MKNYSRIISAAIGALALIVAFAILARADAADTFARPQAVKDTPATFEPVGNPFAGFHVGLVAGVQFTDTFDGLSATGGLFGANVGYNFCLGRLCVGPYVEYAFSDVSFDVVGEPVLTQDDYLQLGVELGTLTGKVTMVSVRIAREWQNWTAGNNGVGLREIDVEADAWVVGGGIKTMIAEGVALKLDLDYVMTDNVEIQNENLERFLGDSNSLRAKVGISYYPNLALPSLR